MRRTLVAAFAAIALLAPMVVTAQASPRNDGPVIPSGDAGNADFGDGEFDDSDIPDSSDEDGNSRQVRLALEYTFATGFHPDANALRGLMPSLYQGKYFMVRHEDRRRCIVRRESGGNYRAVSSGGIYRGAYQMNRALSRGATWMMQREVRRDMGEEGVRMLRELRDQPADRWNRYWQDRAFWTVWNMGDGSRHWGGGAHRC
jgi:hypothetical protein